MSRSSGASAPPDAILALRGPGETRFALLAGDEVVELAHRRDAEVQPGAVYVGRVGAGVPGVSAVFVDFGDALPGVMTLKGRPPPQGSAVAVSVTVPARADKGAELKASDAKVPEGVKAPALLTPAPDPAVAWWDCYKDGITRIVAAPKREAARLKALLGDAPVEDGNGDFFAPVDEAIDAALSAHVALPSGGSIVIEHTAAVTAIDVNSGSADPGTANTEALAAVAIELRRRNIAGHIVVDIIPTRRKVPLARQLGDAVSPDPIPTHVAGVTPLGMIEVVRRRVGLSLAEVLDDDTAAASYKLLREAVAFAFQAKVGGIVATAAPEVVALLQGPLRAALDEARDTLKGEITLKARADLPRARFTFHPA